MAAELTAELIAVLVAELIAELIAVLVGVLKLLQQGGVWVDRLGDDHTGRHDSDHKPHLAPCQGQQYRVLSSSEQTESSHHQNRVLSSAEQSPLISSTQKQSLPRSHQIILSNNHGYLECEHERARARPHRQRERVIYQDNGTEEKVFKKRTVFKEDLKELTEVE